MGVVRFGQEFESPICPKRLFKALMLESHILLPKLMPYAIHSIVFCQGDGGVGSIKQTNFAQGLGFIKYAKHRIDELDVEKCRCKYTLFEGDVIGESLKSVEYEVEFLKDDAVFEGGCICKMWSNYNSDLDDIHFPDEDIELGKERALAVYQVIEDYLIANPTAYA